MKYYEYQNGVVYGKLDLPQIGVSKRANVEYGALLWLGVPAVALGFLAWTLLSFVTGRLF